jgi:hypothetical protein
MRSPWLPIYQEIIFIHHGKLSTPGKRIHIHGFCPPTPKQSPHTTLANLMGPLAAVQSHRYREPEPRISSTKIQNPMGSNKALLSHQEVLVNFHTRVRDPVRRHYCCSRGYQVSQRGFEILS